MGRAYTVQELDALRTAVENRATFGTSDPMRRAALLGQDCYSGHPQRADELAKVVEERVRTHMAAGHVAADLIAADFPDGKLWS